jgi:hypothetical protein
VDVEAVRYLTGLSLAEALVLWSIVQLVTIQVWVLKLVLSAWTEGKLIQRAHHEEIVTPLQAEVDRLRGLVAVNQRVSEGALTVAATAVERVRPRRRRTVRRRR